MRYRMDDVLFQTMGWRWPVLTVSFAVFVYYYIYSRSDPRVSGHVSANSSYDYIIGW